MVTRSKLFSALAALAVVLTLASPAFAVIPKTVSVKLMDGGAVVSGATVTATRQDTMNTQQLIFDGTQLYSKGLTVQGSGDTQFLIDVQHPDYAPAQFTVTRAATTPDSEVDTLYMDPYALCTVEVTVGDNTGAPVAGVTVTVAGETGVTSALGQCTIKVVRNGAAAALSVDPPSGYLYSETHTVDISGASAQVNIVVSKIEVSAVTLDLSALPAAGIGVGGDGKTLVTGRDAVNGMTYNSFALEPGVPVGVSGTGPLAVSGYDESIGTENRTRITALSGDALLHTPSGSAIAVEELHSRITLTGAGHRDLGPVSTAAHQYTIAGGTAAFVGDYPGATRIDGAAVTVAGGVRIGDQGGGTSTTAAAGTLILSGGAIAGGDILVQSGARLDLTGSSVQTPVRFAPGAALLLEDQAVILAPGSVRGLSDLQGLLQNGDIRLDASQSAAAVYSGDGRVYKLTQSGGALYLSEQSPDPWPGPGGGSWDPGFPLLPPASGGGGASESSSLQAGPARPLSAARSQLQADPQQGTFSGGGSIAFLVRSPASRLGFVRAELLPEGSTEQQSKIEGGGVVVRDVQGGARLTLQESFLSRLQDGKYTVRFVFLDSFAEVALEVGKNLDNEDHLSKNFQSPSNTTHNPATGS